MVIDDRICSRRFGHKAEGHGPTSFEYRHSYDAVPVAITRSLLS